MAKKPLTTAATAAAVPDLSFVRAARVMADRGGPVRFILVGCGGTGGWLAPDIARLHSELARAGRTVSTTFVDYDRVEPKNIPRQNFCHAEIGLYKSTALAARLTAAWNVPIVAVKERFSVEMVDENMGWGRHKRTDELVLLLGCVDGATGRRALARALHNNYDFMPHYVWWLDCGNAAESGQVLLGSAPTKAHLRGAFTSAKVCKALPSPALQAPELLKKKPEELTDTNLSCAELMERNEQSLMVNKQAACVAARYAFRLTTGRALKYFATYFDQETGAEQSRYVTPEAVARVVKMPTEFVMPAQQTMTASEFVRGRRRAG
jgi:PRTRC genetic system ThiF family protein